MDMHSKNQYLKALIEERGYLLKSKKEKSRLLDEYCKTTKQNRNYVIRKIRSGLYLRDGFGKRRRKVKYDGEVKRILVETWRIFDYPCGQRLEPLLKTEVRKLRALGELVCSDGVAQKLKEIDASTIDEKLSHQKEVERQKRKYHRKIHPLLYQKIPVKVFAEQDRNIIGNIQLDLIEHCGSSAAGEFIHTLSTTDISLGWWEGEAIMGRAQERTFQGIQEARIRYPSPWKEIHSDNGAEFINAHLFRYTAKEGLDFSRSRPYKKNDNCLVEQKNWTHVKKFVGYHRYDTEAELGVLKDLYRNELRFYKNFFQPVIKLVSKARIGGRIHRKYDIAKTPYRRAMESKEIPENKKQELKKIYLSLNPAQLKRNIDAKLDILWKAYQQKNKSSKVELFKKQRPMILTFYTRQPEPFHLPS